MASITRLTNNSDETDIASLISKDNIFSIPFFQRPYKWKPERVRKLQQDILNLVDEESDFHFLGAVIVHGRRTNPSDPDVFEVIDGQQRLTTIFLFICAAIKVLCEAGEFNEASGLFQRYIGINRTLRNLSNCRLHSCKEDRAQMNEVIWDLLKSKEFCTELGSFKYSPLPTVAGTANTGTLRANYSLLIRFLKSEFAEAGTDRIRNIYSCLLNKVTVVQIDVKDPASGPTIFDSLNSRQEPMTIGDLVRNGIFARVADQSPDDIEVIDTAYWQPFYQSFDNSGKNYFDSFFFPYGLTQNPNLRKTEVYNYLNAKWQKQSDPTEIINELARYQPPFMDVMCGTNTTKLDASVSKLVLRLYKLGVPTSVLPFLMILLAETRAGIVKNSEAESIILAVENFLVRRATCGIEPTGLHSVFKRMWTDLNGDYSATAVRRAVQEHRTVAWPDNATFSESIRYRNLYGARITPFLLQAYDSSLGGDTPNVEPWIEHVLPQTLTPSWQTHFSREDHARYLGTLANLVPLSPGMNRSLGNQDYEKKRASYSDDSMYRTARKFAQDYEKWTVENLEIRAGQLSDWALRAWPEIQSTPES